MGKRDNGTGTIYQRENGSWVGKIYTGIDDSGKKKFKYFSGKSQAEVKRKIRDYNADGSKLEAKRISVGEYATKWLKTYKFGSVKPSSYDALERTIQRRIIPKLGFIQLQQLTSDDIQAFLIGLKNVDGYSYSTVKKAYDCLGAILKHARIKGDINTDPMLLVNMPEQSLFGTKQIKIFSPDECEKIVSEATRKYKTGAPVYIYGDVYILILNTGLRIGEVIGLRKDDWDRKNMTIHVRRNIQSVAVRSDDGERGVGKRLVQNTAKTYSGDRVIPLNKNASEALSRLCEGHPESEYIVCSSKGTLVPPERIDRTFYRILNNVGLEQTGVHTLRHTFASMLFAKKVDVKTVSSLLGHSSIQITLNTYIHLIGDPARDAVAVLDDL